LIKCKIVFNEDGLRKNNPSAEKPKRILDIITGMKIKFWKMYKNQGKIREQLILPVPAECRPGEGGFSVAAADRKGKFLG
jgi:hypothetical protein